MYSKVPAMIIIMMTAAAAIRYAEDDVLVEVTLVVEADEWLVVVTTDVEPVGGEEEVIDVDEVDRPTGWTVTKNGSAVIGLTSPSLSTDWVMPGCRFVNFCELYAM